MITRKADDGTVQNALRHFSYPSQEATFRKDAKDWSSEDFLYALDRYLQDALETNHVHFGALIRKMREERENEERLQADQVLRNQQHAELLAQAPSSAKPAVITTLSSLQLLAENPSGYSAVVSPEQLAMFKELGDSGYISGQIGPDTHDAAETMVDHVRLNTQGRLLMEQLKRDQLPMTNPTIAAPAPEDIEPNAVFIVHGHDKANLERLQKLLVDRYKLRPIVLSTTAGQGRTIIEKFEEEAARAAFAFVLYTPDDIIKKGDQEYRQARPNVIFELGWFYGRLGRAKVCLIFQEGTTIHSDLNGISQIRFKHSIEEKVAEIDSELISGKMIRREDLPPDELTGQAFFQKAKRFF